MTVPTEEAPANSVPAAAVIRRVQALIGITAAAGTKLAGAYSVGNVKTARY